MGRLAKCLFTSLAAGVVLGAAISGYSVRYDVHDWWRLRGYSAPVHIQSLAQNTAMSSKAQKMFYAMRPSLENRESFNSNCRDSEYTIILGCYVVGRGIYIFDVTDERLSGIKEVTAAHEMLHVAYERLSSKEKERIDRLTQEAYMRITDDRLKKNIEVYRSKDPSSVPNELHSIIGTEIRVIDSELEAYYARYFENRLRVVGYAEIYAQAFVDRENKIKDYDNRILVLKEQIDTGQADLSARLNAITLERKRLETLLSAKQYAEYNAGVDPFNREISRYNIAVKQIQSVIDEHNKLVTERNNIALEENELIKAIDSRLTTIQTE